MRVTSSKAATDSHSSVFVSFPTHDTCTPHRLRKSALSPARARFWHVLSTSASFGEQDRELIRRLCKAPVYDGTRKLWGTKSVSQLEPLMNSRKWWPTGIREEWADAFEDAVRERCRAASAHAEAVSAVKHEVSIKAIEKAAAEANGGGGGGGVILNARQREERIRERERDALSIPPTPEEMARCAEMGITHAIVDASPIFGELGPRTGLSREGRLLRWYDVAIYHTRCDFEDLPNVYFDEQKMKPHIDRCVADLNANFAARAADAQRQREEMFAAA